MKSEAVQVTYKYTTMNQSRLFVISHFSPQADVQRSFEGLRERTKYINIFLFFPPITQSCSVSDVLFTGGKGVSDFSVLK